MKRASHAWLIIVGGLLAVAALFSLLSYCSSQQLSQEIHEMTETETDPQVMTTTWEAAAGTMTLTTPRNQGESDEDWAARHAASLAAMQAQFPKV